jgi:RimJ/RimL family protein N-acetyltransferase
MKESKIDTARFGFKVGKTDGEIFQSDKLKHFYEFKKQGYKLIIARVNMKDIELVNSMEEIGFRIKDAQITYKHNLLNLKDSPSFNPSVTIREFKETDTPILVEMAKKSFNNYGHYFNNNRLDKQKCLEIYGDWAYQSCTDHNVADKIIVACENNTPVGYLSFKIYDMGFGKKYSAGGMGAVDPNQRGKNIFPQILKSGLDWSFNTGLDWCEHNVIVDNFPVNRSMNKLGFKPFNPLVTMHCWLD